MKGFIGRVLFLWCLCSTTWAQSAQVVFLNPGKSNEDFWVLYSRFMQAAANSLGMDLQVLYAERDPHQQISQARQILLGSNRPDYLLFSNEEYVAPEVLRLAAHSGVKLFMVHNVLTADQQKALGAPREKYPNWIGSLISNDDEAGYLIADQLIRQHQASAGEGPVDMLAFAGNRATPVSQARERGLRKALAEHPQVRLRQLALGNWSQQRSYEQAQLLFTRYPDVRLVWAANDQMAFGAIQALQERGGKPGHDVLFSAINSSERVLQARTNGDISVLASGHFTLGGWAMVMLHDYHAGLDFAARGGIERKDRLFVLLDAQQAGKLRNRLQKKDFDLDFRRFSAVGQPHMRNYTFSLRPLLY
ncbi:ABC transporter substrate-binding protein [Pseudomonas sp. LS44]|uniref:ABC transporter substrate-binding protein n=1 Tax=Pseudomonas sp. LS44 TaxID=1357074 RepID=UPI00215A9ECA|nr:ABC transporter substrate-binding protein [Pseudomonas sp. LS44]UVE19502.1 ABC transporter substrate-binding protein [Pseudomonas sp. LS44]